MQIIGNRPRIIGWLLQLEKYIYVQKTMQRSTVRFRSESFVGELHREKSIHPKNKPPAQLKMRGFQWLLVCAILCVQLKYYSSQQVVEFFGTCTNDEECPDYAQCENTGGVGNQCRCEDGFDAIDGIITSVGNAVTECRGIWYFILYILYISTILPFCIKSWCYKIANNELLFLFFLIVWSTWSKTRYIMYNCGCFWIKSIKNVVFFYFRPWSLFAIWQRRDRLWHKRTMCNIHW